MCLSLLATTSSLKTSTHSLSTSSSPSTQTHRENHYWHVHQKQPRQLYFPHIKFFQVTAQVIELKPYCCKGVCMKSQCCNCTVEYRIHSFHVGVCNVMLICKWKKSSSSNNVFGDGIAHSHASMKDFSSAMCIVTHNNCKLLYCYSPVQYMCYKEFCYILGVRRMLRTDKLFERQRLLNFLGQDAKCIILEDNQKLQFKSKNRPSFRVRHSTMQINQLLK